MIDVSIIFVNWNSANYLRESIASVYEHTRDVRFEVIVVDNASPQAGVDELQRIFPEIMLLKSEKNLGFAGANNLGFKNASGSYLLFLNPDTKLVAPAIEILLEQLKTLPDAGIAGCKLLNTDLTVQTSCIQRFPTIANQVMDIEYLRLKWPGCRLWDIAPLFSDSTMPVAVEMISGACMMMPREVFERAGMFAEDYFMYAEDLDLCYKVAQLGLINYYIGDACIVHHGGKSTGGTVDQWATVMKLEAISRFCTKTKGRIYGRAYRLSMGSVATLRLVILALMRTINRHRPTREKLDAASAKWNAVFRWATGSDRVTGLLSNR